MEQQRPFAERTQTGPKRRHLTTVVLEELGDGRWRATQTGLDVEGTGDSAAEAATAYGSKISGDTNA